MSDSYLNEEPFSDSYAVSATPLPAPVTTPAAVQQPIKEKIPASADNDTATQQTISKMAEYARAGASDPVVKHWAEFGAAKFAPPPGFSKDRGAVWSDFFLLKHCLNFVNDEPRLFEVGEPEALDLLIAPAVLVRMENPAEDCDGFAMLTASLLQIQGIKCWFVTIACDPSDRDRWSHVFAMAEVDGTRIPVDASKGKFPGWMVPRKHIFKWQTWDMDGKPVAIGPPEQNTLHGYRRRGVGDDAVPPDFGLPGFFNTPDFIPPVTTGGAPAGVNVADLSWTPASISASNPSLSATDISKIIAAATSGALNIYKQTQSPGLVPGTNLVYDPGTNRFLPASGYGAGVSSIFGNASTNMPAWLLPVGLLALGLIVLPSLMGRK